MNEPERKFELAALEIMYRQLDILDHTTDRTERLRREDAKMNLEILSKHEVGLHDKGKTFEDRQKASGVPRVGSPG